MTDPYAYHLDEAVLTVPPGFVDGSTNVLRWGEGDDAIALTIQRLPRGESLEGVALADVETTLARMPGGKVDESGPFAGGLETWRVCMRHVVERQTVYLVQCFVDAEDRILVVSATGHAKIRQEIDRVVEDVVASVRLRA